MFAVLAIPLFGGLAIIMLSALVIVTDLCWRLLKRRPLPRRVDGWPWLFRVSCYCAMAFGAVMFAIFYKIRS